MSFLLKNTQQVLLSAEDIVRRFRDLVNKALQKEGLHISYDQWIVLNELAQQQGLSQIELSMNTKKEPASISRILTLLVKRDLVERVDDKNNKRTKRIYITTTGAEITKKSNVIFNKIAKHGFEGVYDQEINLFVRILNKVESNFDKKGSSNK